MEFISSHPLFIFSFLVTVLFLFYYFHEVVETPVLRFSESDFLLRVIERTPHLTKKYYPTFWCFNQHLMLLLLMLREYRTKPYLYDQLEQLKMKDGGITGLAWSGTDELTTQSDSPIVVVFHTISGDEQDVKSTVKYLRERYAWIVVVCIRRGHGDLPLTKPKVNTMGSTSDLKEQLAYIQKKFPKRKMFGVGISAGSGLLARYLGEAGVQSKFAAAVAVSPAYDIEKAFHRVHPVYSKIMGQRMINYFLKNHYESLSKLKGVDELFKIKTIGEFQDKLHTISGFKDRENYYYHSNPVLVANNIKTPLLVLNSADDPICVNQNVLENLHWLETLPNTIHVHTKRGSHIAYFEGIKANSWSDKVIGEYFAAVQKENLPKQKLSPNPKKKKKRM
ncbi:alpha/beta hydrolase [Leptospira sp. 2 VSF19]|uniref:Alpha/beta hydrolase n=1 Tax=Leptospira soteropolitanensis TaxID=2950025 RepID=A0AAW5VNB8_9LEPT|nr:alpha/beta fold hydrolase [Leptospira soteropolitanensis]MCW7493528.1 alpha/beta hydrolase [Leptospira soteropolitanensis]MCW7500940.1 alpha/beta hydrolase [Leptospira soteropolitanensis]MCW7523380.1 alpha/beta hydrolase [Leptospira soteropolitanensis]MCW7527241.1 alpha/beta hydrolase [Leptospira soteropolitanensis]MCW7531098.1 alpha/beta hydrolase [Leptospira soteropolitanensis]